MLLINLKIFYKFIRRHLWSFFINISNFSIGISCTLILALYVLDETSYDDFHALKDRIYRISYETNINGEVDQFASSSILMAPYLLEEISAVEKAVRVDAKTLKQSYLTTDEINYFNSQDMYIVDPEFLDLFNYDLISGNKESLADFGTVIISESLAKKTFGEDNPLGETIIVNNGYYLEVAGIFKEESRPGHFDFDALVSWSTFDHQGYWYDWWVQTYVLFNEGFNEKDVKNQLAAFSERQINPAMKVIDGSVDLLLYNVADIHLHSNLLEEISPNGNVSYVNIIFLLGTFFLVLFCTNYINLSVVSANGRLTETGIKKALGLTQFKIANTFIVESVVLTFFSAIIGVGLVYLLLPFFNSWSNLNLDLNLLFEGTIPVIMLVSLIILAIIAGVYPAYRLSRTSAVQDLKKNVSKPQEKMGIQLSLMGVQFIMSLVGLICTFIILNQFEFISKVDKGFVSENVYVIEVPDQDYARTLADLLQNESAISSVALSEDDWGNFITSEYKFDSEFGLTIKPCKEVFVDSAFFTTLGIDLLDGRNFSHTRVDYDEAFLINEVAAREFANGNALNLDLVKPGLNRTKEGKVIGIVKDFKFASLHDPVEPLIINLTNPRRANYVYVSAQPNAKESRVVDILKANHEEVFGAIEMKYELLDQMINESYADDRNVRSFFIFGTIIMLLIAGLGVYGVSAFTAIYKTKEFGLRKVFGASGNQLIVLHMKTFLKVLLIAFPMSCLIAFLFSDLWMQGFAFRAGFKAGSFIIPLFMIVFVILFIIFGHALKLARLQPAIIFRSE